MSPILLRAFVPCGLDLRLDQRIGNRAGELARSIVADVPGRGRDADPRPARRSENCAGHVIDVESDHLLIRTNMEQIRKRGCRVMWSLKMAPSVGALFRILAQAPYSVSPGAACLARPSLAGLARIMPLFLLLLSAVPSGQSFVCTPVAIWDGDGPIWCAEGPRIRLSGIAARETDGSCSPGHPCPKADAKASRDHLVSLVGTPAGTNSTGHVLVRGPAMRCVSKGGAGGNRTAAFCTSPRSGDLSCAMVRDGFAARWNRYWGKHRCK